MIKKISSTLPSFKNVVFHPGLNVIVAKKSQESSNRQTRNRAGKSSLIEIIHFLLASNQPNLMKSPVLKDVTFKMEFEVGSNLGYVKRVQGQNICISNFVDESPHPEEKQPQLEFNLPRNAGTVVEKEYSQAEWAKYLREQWFEIKANDDGPSLRELINYFARKAGSGAFIDPLKPVKAAKNSKTFVPLMFLLGLNWKIGKQFDELKQKEDMIRELKKAKKEGVLSEYVGRAASQLHTEIVILENELKRSQKELSEFKVLPEYSSLQEKANKLKNEVVRATDKAVILNKRIAEIKQSFLAEKQPQLSDLETIFKEANKSIPAVIKERYEAVALFHDSIIKNRIEYFKDELAELEKEVITHDRNKTSKSKELAEAMQLLKSHGALDQFNKLQSSVNAKEANLLALKKQHKLAIDIENLGSELKLEKAQLENRLQIDYREREERVASAILAYEECSSRLYESAGTMSLEATSTGPKINFDIQGKGSAGITKMEVFCFDMMLMQLCAQQSIGPRFLIHDSELFDGVDGRQLIKALQIGSELAQEYGFQYIVTLNEDDAFKESIDGFDLRAHIVNLDLNDEEENGGLFGVRF